MKNYTLIKTRDVTNDTCAKYRDLVNEFESEIKLNFQKMLNNPNFCEFLNDIQLTNPEIIEIRQPTKIDYGCDIDDSIKYTYDGTLSVNNFTPENYGLPGYFNQVKDLLSFVYGLIKYFKCSVIKIYECHVDWRFEGRGHLFKNIEDFLDYINNTCGYKMELSYSPPCYTHQGDYIFQKKGISLFSSDYDYGRVTTTCSFYLPCRFILYKQYTDLSHSIKVEPSWY